MSNIYMRKGFHSNCMWAPMETQGLRRINVSLATWKKWKLFWLPKTGLFLPFAAWTAVVGLKNDPYGCETTMVRMREGWWFSLCFHCCNPQWWALRKEVGVTFCCKFPFPQQIYSVRSQICPIGVPEGSPTPALSQKQRLTTAGACQWLLRSCS